MNTLLNQLELLAGQKSNLKEVFDECIDIDAFEKGTMGVSQMNELLLTAGFDRITEDFFMFLCAEKPAKYIDGTTIKGRHTNSSRAVRKVSLTSEGSHRFLMKACNSCRA